MKTETSTPFIRIGFLLATVWLICAMVSDVRLYQLTPKPSTTLTIHIVLDVIYGLALLVLFFFVRSLLKRAAAAGSLLRATLDSTTDAILVVNRAGKIVSYNQRFALLWQLSPAVLDSGDDEKALASVLDQLREPEKFLAKVKELYRLPEAESVDDTELKDGRIFERHSLPQRLDGEVVGRVWSFRNVTAERRSAAILQASEDRYRTLFDYSPAGFLRLDESGQIIDANDSITQMTGYARAEIIGQQVGVFTPSGRVEEIQKNLQKILAGGIHVHEVENLTKQGQRIFFKVVETCVKFPDGHREILCNVTDITARQRHKLLLENQKSALESIVNKRPLVETLALLCRMLENQNEDALASVLLLDSDGRHLRHGAGPSLPTAYHQQIDGLTIGPRVGSCGTAAFTRQQVIVENIATDPLWTDFAKLAEQHELRACWSTPIFDENGKVLGTFAIYSHQPSCPRPADFKLMETITHLAALAISKARSDVALRESESRLATIFNSSPVGIAIAQIEDGKILDANAAYARIFGYSTSEKIGHTTYELKLWTNPEERTQMITALHQQGSSVEREIKFRKKNGDTGDLLASVKLIHIDGRECILAMTTDFTERKYAQQALAESGQRISALFNLSPDAIFVETLDGHVLDVNEAACRLHGLPREKLIGMTTFELVPEEQRALVAAAQAKLGTDELRITEGISLTKDGRKVPVELIARRISYTGQPALLINVRDISQRKQAEALADQQQKRFKLIFDSMPIGIAFNTIRPDGTVTRNVNEAHLRICGITREQSNDPQTYQKITHPDDRSMQAKLISDANHRRRKLFSVERRYVHADNTIVWVSLSFQREIYPDGTIEELTTVVDITQRKLAEEKFSREQARFKLIFDTIPIGISFQTTHPDGSVTRSVNDAHLRISGLKREQHNEPDIYTRITHPEDRVTQAKLHSLMTNGAQNQFSMEKRYLHSDGKIVWVRFTYQRALFADGTAEQLISVADITEHKRLEEQLRQSQKMEAIGQLSGGIAHDFNNILTAILGNATLLSDPVSSAAEAQECVQEITRAARRAADLTRQLLLFSRKQAMQPAVMDLNHAINLSLKMLQRILGEDIIIQTELSPGAAPVFADNGMIEQVILNLAVNARDALPRGGRIQIQTRLENTRHPEAANETTAAPFVCLTISDNGTGIPPEILPRIFEPFFTTKEIGKGTGLGLATVYGIIQQHNGWITVTSPPGKGATFQIFLPLFVGHLPIVPPAPTLAELPRGTGTILVAEDELPVRNFLAALLERLGYSVLLATNGTEALNLWVRNREKITLVITDIIMPGGMTGIDLASQLLAKKPELKIVFISGYTGTPSVAGPALIEGKNFSRKPFTPQALAETVHRTLVD